MTTPTDYRALCAELTDELEEWIDGYLINDPADEHTESALAMVNRARAALAAPQQGATMACEALSGGGGGSAPGPIPDGGGGFPATSIRWITLTATQVAGADAFVSCEGAP